MVLYEGAPEIIVNKPAQIEIIGQPTGGDARAAARRPRGQACEGHTSPSRGWWSTYKSDKVIFLNFSRNRNDFKAVIFASAWPRWPQRPDKRCFGRNPAHHQVKLYEGVPEIIVDEPEQVEVVGG